MNAPERVQWIRDHAIRFCSIDPADVDFSDLRPLQALIGDARVVQLGEQSHGDGACFQTKIRLIKFLHQELGFDVLAFESGLYDCHKAWQAYTSGAAPIEAARLGVFGIWTGSSQTAALWDYLAQTASSKRPLELCGFDCQFTAAASAKLLSKDLHQLIERLDVAVGIEELKLFDDQLQKLIEHQQPPGSQESYLAVLKRIAQAVDDDDSILSPAESGFWRQLLISMQAHGATGFASSSESTVDVMARDQQMAENFVWLTNKHFAGRKLIVWAASFHIVRNPADIEVPDGSVDYSEMIQMGQRVHQQLGDDVFTIGFTANEGQAGTFFGNPFEIPDAPLGTLESLCTAAGLQNALVPLRDSSQDRAWLDESLHARPLGYHWMNAKWPNHFDAMIFNREMTPSTRSTR